MASSLHVVMLPWLAMGHLLPFLELSKRLARRGHRISLLTTPSNISRLLPAIPPHLSPLIRLVELRMPSLENHTENTTDLSDDDARSDLAKAYNSLEPQVSLFLQQQPVAVDWILHDFGAAAWAPRVAADNGVAHAFLCLFNAAAASFLGGPQKLTAPPRSAPEDFTRVPEWIPFPSTVAYRLHEARQLFKSRFTTVDVDSTDHSAASNPSTGPFMAIRSCDELEIKWLELLSNLMETQVVPLGLFPPSAAEAPDGDDDQGWVAAIEWLDKQETGSVVYAAFGSEAKLTTEQAAEVALGLELSGLPFVWAAAAAAPEGFEERMEGRGVVCRGWVPQVKLLAHPSVGGFLTHGGWNSLVEGLSAGVVMVVLPLLFEQGLNARHMVDMGMALEVPRDDEDGQFSGDGVAGCLRMAMVEEGGEGLREKAIECKKVFGDEELQNRYVDKFIEKLWEHKKV